MAKKEKKLSKKGKGFFAEFREFISKGNALMLAIGVVKVIVQSLLNN